MVAETLSERLFTPAVEPKYVTTPDNDPPQTDDDWNQIESEAAVIVETDNANFWRKGELALRVERKRGEGGIKELASRTKLGAAKTLYETAQLALFFPPSARAQVPSLTKEYFRQAFRAIKGAQREVKNPLGAAMGFLKQAEEENETKHTSAAEVGRRMKKEFGQPVKYHWRYEPEECHTVGEYLAFVMPEPLLKKIHDEVLAHQDKPGFTMSVSFSYTYQPQAV